MKKRLIVYDLPGEEPKSAEGDIMFSANPLLSRVYVIVNNGFYDSFQNVIAVKIIWKWCDKCALTKGRALAVGAGGLAQAAPVGKGPLAKLGGALDALSEDIQKSRSGEMIFVKPAFPRLMYKIVGNMSFNILGKKNGLKKRDIKK